MLVSDECKCLAKERVLVGLKGKKERRGGSLLFFLSDGMRRCLFGKDGCDEV